MTGHDPEVVANVADGDQVLDGVAPPTERELRLAAELAEDALQAEIDAHVEEVNIHDGRDR